MRPDFAIILITMTCQVHSRNFEYELARLRLAISAAGRPMYKKVSITIVMPQPWPATSAAHLSNTHGVEQCAPQMRRRQQVCAFKNSLCTELHELDITVVICTFCTFGKVATCHFCNRSANTKKCVLL